MAFYSSKEKKGLDMLLFGVERKAPKFKCTLAIVKTLDPSGVQSQIPPKVLLINDICTHFKCVILDIGTLEMDYAIEKLCVNGVLKPKHQHLETKGLTHIPHMPCEFQVKWIRFILSQVYNGKLWLEQLVLIKMNMIHQISSLPILAKAKMTKTLDRVELERKP